MKVLLTHVRTNYVIAVLAAIYLIFMGFDVQHDDGIVGVTRKNGNGCTCHNGTPTAAVSVWITGPTYMLPGQTATFTLHMTGGPSQTGGLNVASAHGVLGTTGGDTKIMSSELTHTSPKPFVNDSVAWTFTYQAPVTPGRDTLFSAANSTNNNLIPDHSDQWNFGTDYVITIANIIPSLSGWGLAGLTLLLLTTGFWVLVKRRQGAKR